MKLGGSLRKDMGEAICKCCGVEFHFRGTKRTYCNDCLGVMEIERDFVQKEIVKGGGWLAAYNNGDRLTQWCMIARYHHMTYGQYSALKPSEKHRLMTAAVLAHK